MTVEFKPIQRTQIPLLIGVAGGTGSGKTMSALRLARGLAGGKPFAGIDTENGRMSAYAEEFPEVQVAEIKAPFRPTKYAETIEDAERAGYPVIVVDSASHEWYGDGGCLDWHDEIMGGDQRKNLAAWIEPKKAHKRMVTRLLQLNAHVILCFRAEPKVEVVETNGRKEYVAKKSLTGLDGWIPIAEKNLPYELTASFLLMADKPGVPQPIKLYGKHRSFVPLDRPLDESVGEALGQWAAGGNTSAGEPQAEHTTGSPTFPAAVSTAIPDEQPSPADDTIATSAQQTLILTKASRAGLDDDARHKLIEQITGQPSTKAIPKALVNDVLAAIDSVAV